jgi:2-methylcitrate dehydratase PrpD
MTSPEERLTTYVAGIGRREPSVEITEKVVHLLLDALSLGRSAASHPVVTAVRGIVGSGGPALDWGTGERLAPSDAALVNGTATHAFFQDDTDMNAWGHPASLVVPAVVAAAQLRGADLPAVLRGIVAGYSAFSWLAAREEVARELVEAGLRGSPTLGAPAAAMGASAVLGLDEAQTRNALGIAADSTGGTLEPVRAGAQDWRLQNGFASQRGLMAALLAREGVRGPTEPLSGPRGFLSVLARTSTTPAQWAESPTDDAVANVWFKPYPILGDNTAAAVAASTLTQAVGQADVARIRVQMNAHFASYPGTDYAGPFTRTEQMIASTAFNVAALLTHGSFDYADSERLVTDPLVLARAAVVEIEPMDDFGYLDARIEIDAGGTTHRATAADAPRSLFFRDRDTTLSVLRHRHGAELPQLAESLFAAVDGTGAWPALDELLDGLRATAVHERAHGGARSND